MTLLVQISKKGYFTSKTEKVNITIEFMFQKKNSKSILFFNNRDIISFIESCCGQSKAILNEANIAAMEKNSSS